MKKEQGRGRGREGGERQTDREGEGGEGVSENVCSWAFNVYGLMQGQNVLCRFHMCKAVR